MNLVSDKSLVIFPDTRVKYPKILVMKPSKVLVLHQTIGTGNLWFNSIKVEYIDIQLQIGPQKT